MREGPLAELFRATEAAQRRGGAEEPETEPDEDVREAAPPKPIVAAVPDPAKRGRDAEKRREPEPEPEREPEAASAPDRPAAAWLDPLPDHPARLERGRGDASYLAVIRVVGVGGAGLNALDRMLDAGLTQVDFVAINTDIQQLQMSDAPTKVHIGSEITEGLGSGAEPELGRRAAEDS